VAPPTPPPSEASNKALAGADVGTGASSAVKTPPHVSSVKVAPKAPADPSATGDIDAVATPVVDDSSGASPFVAAAAKASPTAEGTAQVPATPSPPPGLAIASANVSERTSPEEGQKAGGEVQAEDLRASSQVSTSAASAQSSAAAVDSAAGGAGGAKKKNGGKKRGGRGKGKGKR
jgi:hypothetical protein